MKDQKGRLVNIATLLNEGWKKVRYFGHSSLLLSRGDERMIYSLSSQRVVVRYKSRPNPILGC